MVRVKHRYLLINILYPEPEQYPRKATLPDTIQFHHPSPDDLTPQLLARAVRDQISLLYGDYGAGLTNSGLNGSFYPLRSSNSATEQTNAVMQSNIFLLQHRRPS